MLSTLPLGLLWAMVPLFLYYYTAALLRIDLGTAHSFHFEYDSQTTQLPPFSDGLAKSPLFF